MTLNLQRIDWKSMSGKLLLYRQAQEIPMKLLTVNREFVQGDAYCAMTHFRKELQSRGQPFR